MGGIGKTTLAREIYNRIFRNFEASSFIADVREESESRRLVFLQKNILSKILMGAEKNISDVEEGKKILRKSLCNKKVLIVLDDVNDGEQVKALARKDWFGPGSIIIVTSRDSHLLKSYWDGVIDIYRAQELNYDEALELFSLKAFKKPHPQENYVDLSINFVSYANGFPLALRILGSSLFGKTLDAWRSARDKLKAKPNRVIMDVLEMSVVGLDDTQRDLFLDIAFLFKDMTNYCIRDTLESLGHYTYDIDVLQDKSLITITADGALWMHDLLKEMGRDIVRRESPEEPGQRSRLWRYKDVLHVLKNNTGTEFVKGIVLKAPADKKEQLSAEAFSKMKNLRLLKIGYVHPPQDIIGGPIQCPQGLIYLSNELRILNWHGYSLKSMPTSFQPNKLVELRMHCSRMTQLWKGIMILNGLKLLDLSDSQNLIVFPDLSGALNLKQLILQGCTKLYKIHASIGDLKQLIQLDLNGCKNISSLPDAICCLMSLKALNLSNCSRLDKLPENIGNIAGLEELDVGGTALRELPPSMVLLKSLKKLSLSGFDSPLSKPINKLLSFPLLQRRSSDPMDILTRSLLGLSSLTHLNLSYCNLRTVPDVIGCLSYLYHLNLRGNNFDHLPKSLIQLSNLSYIAVEGCSSLKTLLPFTPEDTWFPSRLLNCFKLICNYSCIDHFLNRLRHYFLKSYAIELLIPGSEIPKWFSHQSEGTSLNLKGRSDFMGVALCAVFVHRQHHSLPQPSSEISELSIQFHCEGIGIGHKIFCCEGSLFSNKHVKIDSHHLFFSYFPIDRFQDESCNGCSKMDANGFTQVNIKTITEGLEVMKCGARLVYEKDIEKLKQNMAGSSNCSITDYEDDLDDSAKDTKIKQRHDDYDGDGAGPSREEPHLKWIQQPNLIETWIGNFCTQGQGDSNSEEEKFK